MLNSVKNVEQPVKSVEQSQQFMPGDRFDDFINSCQRYQRSDPMERLFGYIIFLRLNSTIEILIRGYLRNWTYVQFQEQLTGTHSIFMWSTLQNRKKVKYPQRNLNLWDGITDMFLNHSVVVQKIITYNYHYLQIF